VLFLVIVVLSLKIYLLHRDMDALSADLRELLSTGTNTLLSVSSNDRQFRKLVAALNRELRLLRQQRQRYVSGDRELKEAVTNISHDLRTPLTAICGYLDLLEREEKSESVERYLSQIENRMEALKSLTEELFRYSVVTSTRELKMERLDMVRVLEESLLSFYGVMQENGIQPVISLPEKAVYRKLDAGALSRIFSNIISNALKYSDGDFSVTMQEDGSVTFTNRAKGLNAVTVGRLFDRFYTVEASRNSTGLGLSIAKLLTERMGGSIEAIYQSEQLHILVKL
jgi:signal transduction histidine kinase